MEPRLPGRMPEFPMPRAPRCKKCDRECEANRPTKAGQRVHYYCYCGKPKNKIGNRQFCTYDDSEGVDPKNPVCDCGYFCRIQVKHDGTTFRACAVGKCSMDNRKPPWRRAASASSPWSSASSPPPSRRRVGAASALDVLANVAAAADPEFVRLLDHALNAAERAEFPTSRSMDVADRSMDMTAMAQALVALSLDTPSKKPSQRLLEDPFTPSPATPSQQQQRRYFSFAASDTSADARTKYGAAGEFFVWTLLSKALRKYSSGLTLDHWQSTTRNQVKQHAVASDWPERDTEGEADIVFPDDHGALSSLLVDHGHLDSAWRGQTPRYLIEVKSSPKDTNKEFYMSDIQYDKVQKYASPKPSNPPGAGTPTIYIIARVANLQEETPTLRLYVAPDPVKDAVSKGLRFKLTWVVEEVEA